MSGKATCIATSNIAFVKYWGRIDEELRLPMNGSVSMNIDGALTTTTIAFDEALSEDSVTLQGHDLNPRQIERVTRQLDRVRERAGITLRARVETHNNFPMGAGVASSASGFAALTVAACAAAGLELSEKEMTILARQGSGSAARSIPAGFVAWHYGETSAASFAEQIAPPEHWDVRNLVAITQTTHKAVGSARGNQLVTTSPFNETRVVLAQRAFDVVCQAILDRDFTTLGEEAEREAVRLHVISMTSKPPIFYWQPATLRIIHAVQDWRQQGLECYFTIDAGANVQVLTLPQYAAQIETELAELDGVTRVIHNRVGHGAQLSDQHLF